MKKPGVETPGDLYILTKTQKAVMRVGVEPTGAGRCNKPYKM
jgi:hypothetical protein